MSIRYNGLGSLVNARPLPNIVINNRSTDTTITYEANKSRLNKISNQFYNNPSYSWLILLANSQLAGIEIDLPSICKLRIPLPLNDVLREYEEKLKEYLQRY